MTARVLTGSKQEIAEKVAEMIGDVREAIVFIDEPIDERAAQTATVEDIFAEMEPFTVRQAGVDDSREAIYQRLEAE
jgi:hypothetical protein